MVQYIKKCINVTIICMVFLIIHIMMNWVTDSFIYSTETRDTSPQIINRSELMFDLLKKLPKCEKESTVVNVQVTPAPETPNKEPLPEISKPIVARLQAAEEYRMARDILSGPQIKHFNPGEIPSTVHYVWCGDKCFTFNNYLGILSIVRILEPLRIFFYYNILPSVNCPFYETWFQELKQSLPYLVYKRIDRQINCNTMDAVDFALEQMTSNNVGGVYVGERAVLTHVPDAWKTGKNFAYQKDGGSISEEMIVFIKQGIDSKNESDIKQFKNNVLSQTNECYPQDQFEKVDKKSKLSYKTSPCVFLTRYLIPEEVVNSSTSLNTYLRWLYYGRRDGLHVKQSEDNDVIWVKPLSGEQRRYPTTASYEWSQYDSPRVINNGLIVSKPKAPFLVKVMESFWYYRDEQWVTNSIFMYYKIFERNPETLNIDNRLQVLCHNGICHPAWFPDYRRGYEDPNPTPRINVEEANAFHFFDHKSPKTFTSFSALKHQNHLEALLVKRVMAAIERAGRTHLLEVD